MRHVLHDGTVETLARIGHVQFAKTVYAAQVHTQAHQILLHHGNEYLTVKSHDRTAPVASEIAFPARIGYIHLDHSGYGTLPLAFIPCFTETATTALVRQLAHNGIKDVFIRSLCRFSDSHFPLLSLPISPDFSRFLPVHNLPEHYNGIQVIIVR